MNPHIPHQKKGGNVIEHVSQLLITYSKVKWLLRFAFSYVQFISQHYKQRTVGEVPLQSIQSPEKIEMIPVYKRRDAIKLPQIDTLGSQH